MVTPKQKGTQMEYRVAYIFERFGYSWDRSRSSLGIDLKISKGGGLRYLVSCKKTSSFGPIYLPKHEVERLKAAAKETKAEGFLCFGFHRTPVLALPLKKVSALERTKHSYKIYPKDGMPLKELLKALEVNVV